MSTSNGINEIVIVDDSPSDLAVLQGILSRAGYGVRACRNGGVALRSIQIKPPALILLDAKMPDMDGYEVCRRLHAAEQTRDIPVIFISVPADEQAKLDGFQAGGADYINKPFSEAEVLARVTPYMKLRQMQNALMIQNIELVAVRNQLEALVEERTAELAAANAHLIAEIADHQQAEDMLRENERMLSQLKKAIETTGIGITITDTMGKILYTNPADAQMHGYAINELIGQPAHIFTSPEYRCPLRQINDNEPVFYDWRRERPNIRRDGSVFPAKLTSNPIYDTHKFRIGTVTVCEDISEQKRMEQALRESEDRLRNIVQNMPILCDAFDQHGVALFWNKECERVTGYTADEIVNNPHALELLAPDPAYRAQVIEQLKAFGHQYRDWELEIRRKDGEKRVIAWSNISRDFPLPGWWSWGVGVDVTTRKQAEEELQRAKDDLEAANAQLQELNAGKDKFFSIIAHDLKNPLNAFLSFADLLDRLDDYDKEKRKALFAQFRSTAEHLFALLDNLLTWARSQQGRIPYAPRPFPLTTLVAQVFDLVRPNADAKQIHLNNTIPRGLTVFADLDLLETVVRNLLTNAIKFTPAGGSVTIAAQDNDATVEISVSDTGIGIAPEKAATLFHIGAKTKQTGTAGEKGTGLGLILCKEFVTRHGGTMGCESVVGQGSVFRFTLPKSRT